MSAAHYISPDTLSLKDISEILIQQKKLALSDESKSRIQHCRQYLEQKISGNDALIYGINTGFGSLCDVRISEHDIEALQANLILSHACGMGDEVPEEIVRIMLLLKIQGLSFGHSAITLEVIERMIFFYNNDVLPVVFQQGSLGASGDLAPLAHLGLPLMGEGEVRFQGSRISAQTAMKVLDIQPLTLKAKEALAILNGTEFSCAYSTWCLLQAERLLSQAQLNTAIGIDAFQCRLSPFDELLHQIRPHKGQLRTAEIIRDLLENSELSKRNKVAVQDPYSFRCVPQVHGASYDALVYITNAVHTEINSVTDNPSVFPDEDMILSGGNFHAQPLALPLDLLAIALSELGNISERRVFQLISGKRGLPDFLTPNPGLHSGLMIPQYTAASIVSQNKQLCTPASVDSIVSCNGQEDHVSMAANAATKCYRVVQNVERLLAIEFMTATQALEFRRPAQSAPFIETVIAQYRAYVPVLHQDRILSVDMHETVDFLRKLNFSTHSELLS
jgi:histidine ammonia-lyase